MKPLHYYSLFIGILLLFSGCEKEVDLDLKEIPPTPVIEAVLSTNAPDSYIKISMTKGFKTDNYDYAIIDYAQINLTDEQGNNLIFTPDNEGIYRTNQEALPEHTYHLEATFDHFQISSEAEMLSIPQWESVTLYKKHDEYNGNYYRIEIKIRDDAPETDYYLIKLLQNSGSYYGEYHLFLTNDNQKTNDYFVLEPVYLYNQSPLEISINHIPKIYYDFQITLSELGEAEYGQSPFTTTVLGNPVSNIQNGLGIFGTQAVSSIIVNIPQN